MSARRKLEIRVHIPRSRGGVMDVLGLLSHHQLPTLTRSCSADGEGLLLLLTTSRPEDVQQVLTKAGYRCETQPVVVLSIGEYQPGPAAHLTTTLGSQGVGIRYSYLSSIDAEKCFMVLGTTDNERALQLFGVPLDPADEI